MDTKYENPIPSSIAQSRRDVHSAPDWEMTATLPGDGIAVAKLAFMLIEGTMIPRQLGPSILMPGKRAAWAVISSSSAFPSGPISLNPAEMTMTPMIPISPHWPMMAGTVFAGVQMTARSAGLGRLLTSA